jgi:hypothetical protein
MDPSSAVDTGMNLIGNFILGGIAIFAVGLMGWAIRELKRVQDARVTDQKAFTTELTAFSSQIRDAQGETVAAINELTVAENQQTDILRSNGEALADCKSSLEGMRQTIDSVVRDAVRGHRHYTSSAPPIDKEDG